jgi:hypothetical protein
MFIAFAIDPQRVARKISGGQRRLEQVREDAGHDQDRRGGRQ